MENISIPVGYVAIPLYEYRYLLSLLPKDAPLMTELDRIKAEQGIIKAAQLPQGPIVAAEIPADRIEAPVDAETIKRKYTKITPEKVEEMNRLRQSGMSVPKIAEKMGIGEQTVRNHLAAYAKRHPDAAHRYTINMTPRAK